MKLLTLEDPTGTFEVTLFPSEYKRFGHLLGSKGPFFVKGQMEQDSGACTITALWLGRYSQANRSSANSPVSRRESIQANLREKVSSGKVNQL